MRYSPDDRAGIFCFDPSNLSSGYSFDSSYPRRGVVLIKECFSTPRRLTLKPGSDHLYYLAAASDSTNHNEKANHLHRYEIGTGVDKIIQGRADLGLDYGIGLDDTQFVICKDQIYFSASSLFRVHSDGIGGAHPIAEKRMLAFIENRVCASPDGRYVFFVSHDPYHIYKVSTKDDRVDEIWPHHGFIKAVSDRFVFVGDTNVRTAIDFEEREFSNLLPALSERHERLVDLFVVGDQLFGNYDREGGHRAVLQGETPKDVTSETRNTFRFLVNGDVIAASRVARHLS